MGPLSRLPVPPPLSKSDFRDRSGELRQALQQVQMDLRQTPTSALLLVAGVDGAGKGETVQLLNNWMDPRWIRTHAFDRPSDDEIERPVFWRYWRRLPPRGELAIFLSAWYSSMLLERSRGGSDPALSAALERARRFEQMLADDGTLIFKLWLHLDRDAQAERFRELEADPLTSWRVTPSDWDGWTRYDEFTGAANEIIEASSTDAAGWHIVEASDDHRRDVEVGDALLVALRSHVLSQGGTPHPPKEKKGNGSTHANVSVLGSVGKKEKAPYREELGILQGRLNALHRQAREADVPVIGVFEGRDASGKGGAIRRVVAALDPRRIDVVRIGAPTDEELSHHYLWRFWRRVPRAGYVTLFDRSWYGRVLAERVEELAKEYEWRRAYAEINDFEHQMVDHGVVLVKFWLDVSRDEQKRRFEARSLVPHKRWKLTEDDRRNRSLWKEYDVAIAEMLERTSTDTAPWTIVPGDDKRLARLEVLHTFVRTLEARLGVPEAASRAAGGDA